MLSRGCGWGIARTIESMQAPQHIYYPCGVSWVLSARRPQTIVRGHGQQAGGHPGRAFSASWHTFSSTFRHTGGADRSSAWACSREPIQVAGGGSLRPGCCVGMPNTPNDQLFCGAALSPAEHVLASSFVFPAGGQRPIGRLFFSYRWFLGR